MRNKTVKQVTFGVFVVCIILEPLLIVAYMYIPPWPLWLILASGVGTAGVLSALHYVFTNPKGLKFTDLPYTAADAARVSKQLMEILFMHPESYIDMPYYRYEFIKGLIWLTVRGGRGINKLPVDKSKIDDAGAARVARELALIVSMSDSNTNMPDRTQFITALFWLVDPEDGGFDPCVNSKIDRVVVKPRIELDAIVVKPRIQPVDVVVT